MTSYNSSNECALMRRHFRFHRRAGLVEQPVELRGDLLEVFEELHLFVGGQVALQSGDAQLHAVHAAADLVAASPLGVVAAGRLVLGFVRRPLRASVVSASCGLPPQAAATSDSVTPSPSSTTSSPTRSPAPSSTNADCMPTSTTRRRSPLTLHGPGRRPLE